MTSVDRNAKRSEIKKIKTDELDGIIAALRATGQDEEARDFEEFKAAIDGLIEDLYSLVDHEPDKIIKKLFGSRISELNNDPVLIPDRPWGFWRRYPVGNEQLIEPPANRFRCVRCKIPPNGTRPEK